MAILVINCGDPTYRPIMDRMLRQWCHHKTVSYLEAMPWILKHQPRGIIILNYQPLAIVPLKALLSLDLPILGIGDGMMMVAALFGGKIISCHQKRVEKILVVHPNPLYDAKDLMAWIDQKYSLIEMPTSFQSMMRTMDQQIVGMHYQHYYGVQFYDPLILKNFIALCQSVSLRSPWDYPSIAKQISAIKALNQPIAIALGGATSVSLSLFLQQYTINLQGIWIETGLEAPSVKAMIMKLKKKAPWSMSCIDARAHFLEALAPLNNGEVKKNIGSRLILEWVYTVMRQLNLKYLALGTLWTDLQPGSGSHAWVYHQMKRGPSIQLIEPFKDLLEEDVQKIAKESAYDDYSPALVRGGLLFTRLESQLSLEKIKLLHHIEAIMHAYCFQYHLQPYQAWVQWIEKESLMIILCIMMPNTEKILLDQLDPLLCSIIQQSPLKARVLLDISTYLPCKII